MAWTAGFWKTLPQTTLAKALPQTTLAVASIRLADARQAFAIAQDYYAITFSPEYSVVRVGQKAYSEAQKADSLAKQAIEKIMPLAKSVDRRIDIEAKKLKEQICSIYNASKRIEAEAQYYLWKLTLAGYAPGNGKTPGSILNNSQLNESAALPFLKSAAKLGFEPAKHDLQGLMELNPQMQQEEKYIPTLISS